VLLLSVPLALQYEAVLTRSDQIAASGASLDEAIVLVNALCAVCTPVEISFLWGRCCAIQMMKWSWRSRSTAEQTGF
jgi:hypothetical protein